MKVTHAEVRMYRMGTGDCFALKFFAGRKTVFRMLVDAGAWSGSRTRLEPYVRHLKKYLGDFADVLLVTHEHKDHVQAFDSCAPLFTDGKFRVQETWLAWTEDDRSRKVQEWQQKYGEKKKALALAAHKLTVVMGSADYKKQFAGSLQGHRALGARRFFAGVLSSFADLHVTPAKDQAYKGGLAGMEAVKNTIPTGGIKYFKPGDVIRDLGEAEDLKIYVLGPPELHGEVKKETGEQGQTYDHNAQLQESDAFAAAMLHLQDPALGQESLLPFDEQYLAPETTALERHYRQADWRRIDYDWLYSSGSLALRLNSLTNNLSLAIAIECGDAGKVLLFPGDAEYGSWASWHRIAWPEVRREGGANPQEPAPRHFTEELLNRTVFYKVSHHLSHNGTARHLGLEMMHHPDLAAMATLDYAVIQPGWTRTMPNQDLVRELLARTKGRLMVMNEAGIFLDFSKEVSLQERIAEARSRMSSRERQAFQQNYRQHKLYLQYRVQF